MFGLDQKGIMEMMKKSLDESKERLSLIKVSGESGGGLVRIELDGNRKFSSLEINVDLKSIEKEDLEDFLAVAFDQAMEKVNAVNESEMSHSAGKFIPGL
jgi:hypothetical protein